MRDTNKVKEIIERISKTDLEHFKVLIPLDLSKKIGTYMLIREDMNFVSKNAELLIDLKKQPNRNEQIEESLWYSLISIYGRCFTDATKDKNPKLEKNHLFKDTIDENIFLQTHDKLMDLRHHFIAHRGNNDNEIPIVYLKLPKNEDITENNTPFEIVSTRYITESEMFLNNIIELVSFLLPKIDVKIKKIGDKLFEDFMTLIEYDKELINKLTLK